MANYAPSEPTVKKGKPPEYGQWSLYREDNGDIYPCIIHKVYERSPDGHYYSVVVTIPYPPSENHPGKSIRCGHIYWVDLGLVTDDPCPPPWPG